MNLLAIDTVTENCSVALALTGNPQIVCLEMITAAGHSRRVHGMVSQLLDRYGIGYADLNGIVVDTGPGSFTGVRIGIGVAQGLAYASGIEVLPVSSLQALAQRSSSDLCVSAIDARMQQVYWAAYRCTSTTPEKLCGPFVSDPANVQQLMDQHVNWQQLSDLGKVDITGLGSGWDSYPDSMPATLRGMQVSRVECCFPSAEALIEIARGTGDNIVAHDFLSPMHLTATYVRNEIVKKPAGLQQPV